MSHDQLQSKKPVRTRLVTQEKLDKRIAAGDGQGVREEYVPWIKIRAFPSLGTSHIVPGVKVHRGHHLLSNAEYHYHVILEQQRSIVDIREQFPLLPAAETHAIASSLGVRPPVYPGTSVPLVLTTDFLITEIDKTGTERLAARSMKYAKEIEEASQSEKNRLTEKLEIERQYWARRDVEWKLVIYERLSQVKIHNLLVLRGYAHISAGLATDKNISCMMALVASATTDVIPLKTLIKKIAKAMYMEYVAAKRLFFYLVWVGRLVINMNEDVIELSKPLKVIVEESIESPFTEIPRHA
ncbi:TnsA endonuclease N-terminal domain-containing protein [Pseudomonas sp. BGr12]|uniref:TnsA endonuclease N-terminal domain-containing protein n=1 Tax=Pseudomonas sp. BGr12 TaxID=2936269 RepID=UPI002559DFC0|nr:TnsA endonuclease N-terminal domain-containing protein [Pseudomonas sp. BJa5]MDL2428568.1 TnsA endonuclease N-terminal domain-containing protein [Pseudomonas sp. BJa5]